MSEPISGAYRPPPSVPAQGAQSKPGSADTAVRRIHIHPAHSPGSLAKPAADRAAVLVAMLRTSANLPRLPPRPTDPSQALDSARSVSEAYARNVRILGSGVLPAAE